MNRHGYYTDLSEDKQGNLVITRTTNVWRERGRFQKLSAPEALQELLEDHLCNGLEWVLPEDIGALTDAPILSDSVLHDEETGKIIDIEKTWWFPDYCIRNEVEEIIKKGRVVFILAE